MKSFVAACLLAIAAANPVEIRQNSVGSTANEFTEGGCRDIIMLFARGSTEIGNMGTICGPQTGEGLKEAFGESHTHTPDSNLNLTIVRRKQCCRRGDRLCRGAGHQLPPWRSRPGWHRRDGGSHRAGGC